MKRVFRRIMAMFLLPLLGIWGNVYAAEGMLYLSITPREHRTDVRVRFGMSNSDKQLGTTRSEVRLPLEEFRPDFSKGRFEPRFDVSSPDCTELTYIHYNRSIHPGPHAGRKFNQKNDGFGVRCFLDENRTFFIVSGGLENSQYGSTGAFGPGVRFSTPELRLTRQFGISANAGIEAPVISYEWPSRRRTIFGVLPMPFTGVNLHLPQVAGINLGTIGYNRNFLPEGIKLYYITWSTSFRFNL